MSVKCSVKSCGTSQGKFYYFPTKDLERKQQWITFCENEKLSNLPDQLLKKRAICGLHFEKKYILNTRLTTSAVPSLLNLPSKSEDYIDVYM